METFKPVTIGVVDTKTGKFTLAEREAMTLERQAFEKWMDRDWPLWINDPEHPAVQRAWRLWQHLSRAAEPVGYLDATLLPIKPTGYLNLWPDPKGISNYAAVYLHPPEPARDAAFPRLLDREGKALHWLVELAAAAFILADNTEDDGKAMTVQEADFRRLNDALDALDTLPDDKPGWTLGPAGKADWALRRIFSAEGPIAIVDAAMAQESGE